MKASPADQNELLRLQAADTRLAQLAHAAKNLPQLAELAKLQPEVEALRARWIAATGELEDARAELKRVESDVEVVEARVKRDTDRVQQTASVKDVQALEAELASLARRKDDLEEIELNVMERVGTLEGALAAVEAERAELGSRVEALEAQRDEEAGKLDVQRKAAAADRAAIAEALPADLIELYERQRTRYGIGAAALIRGVSMGSNVKLTESDLSEIRRAAADDVVLCPDSGAILVRGEDSGL
ncbi:C4-type zinc ribbon domain-containing protein [Leifsonia sp. NPDC077715]|uniref:zinc ribbon domain-containing protein n=1 Tax=Leifsonia sp. NPDC077715 TaxID=3155539 RepID=UPI00342616DE